jgi:putative endonuclease
LSSDIYSLYVLRCADGSLYTGIALDVERRIKEHEIGPRGAKYLRGRGPLSLAFQAPVGNRSAASRVELRVKNLPRHDKEKLIAGTTSLAQVSGNSGE